MTQRFVPTSFLAQNWKRLWWLWLMLGLLVFVLVLAPGLGWRSSGSTYSRSPDGYGAWYNYMTQQRQIKIQRWRRPIAELVAQAETQNSPATLIQVRPNLVISPIDDNLETWLDAGNTLIILGIQQPVSKANFSSRIPSPSGNIQIDTARRLKRQEVNLLQDQYGGIVWQPKQPKGRLIYAVTPHFAANAYQKQAGNFAFLADLVKQQPVYVDEYLHGYRDRPPQSSASGYGRRGENGDRPDVIGYLLRTPLLIFAVQAIVLLAIFLWAKNRRFGAMRSILPPPTDNTTAYVQALAGALRKANSGQFVVETVTQAEIRQLQRQLGLGNQPINFAQFKLAWLNYHSDNPEQRAILQKLESLQLESPPQKSRTWSDRDLLSWLQTLQSVRKTDT
jgi:hypothetical protein